MLLKSLVEKLVGLLKKEPSYRFETEYTSRQLFMIVFYRGLQVLRGLRIKFLIKSKGFVFCGRSVSIEHGYMIQSGENLIIEDNVVINALSENGVFFGRNVTLSRGTIIACTGVIAHKGHGLKIGDFSGINSQSYLGCQGGIVIGSSVIMGPGVKIFSENHNFNDIKIPIRLQGVMRKQVIIDDDCWIGSGSIILAGVHIGKGAVVAAGSVVTKDVLPYSVVAGVPAHLIKSRDKI